MNSAVVLGAHDDAFSTNGTDTSGRLISWDLKSDVTHTPHIAWVLNDKFREQPTLANGVLYVNNGFKLAALDELSGRTLWTWSPENAGLVGPMVATDNLLFVTVSSSIFSVATLSYPTYTYAIDLKTHLPVWSFPTAGSLAVSDGTLYLAGLDGNLYAIGVPEPTTVWLLVAGISLGWQMRLRKYPVLGRFIRR